jgi:hypothetical protein
MPHDGFCGFFQYGSGNRDYCLSYNFRRGRMIRTIAYQVFGHAQSPDASDIQTLAWRSFRPLTSGLRYAGLAFVRFWNIPVLGAEETPESRYYRTKRFI